MNKISLIGLSGKKQHGKDTVAKMIQYLTTPEGSNTFNLNNYLTDKSAYLYAGNNWKVKQFAGKLKQIVSLLTGCSIHALENENFKNRELGEEWRRYYWYHYKFANNENLKGRLGSYHSNTDDAEIELSQLEYSIWNKMRDEAELKSEIPTPRILLQEIGTEGLRGVHPLVHINGLFVDYQEYEPCICTGGMMCFMCQEKIADTWIVTDCRFKNEVSAIKKRNGIVIRVENPRIVSTDSHASETELDNEKFDYLVLNDGNIEDLVIKVKDMLNHFNIL